MSRFVGFLSFLLVAATFTNCDGHSNLPSVICVDSELEFQLDIQSAKMTTCNIILKNEMGLVDNLKVDKYCSRSNVVRELCTHTCGLCEENQKNTTKTRTTSVTQRKTKRDMKKKKTKKPKTKKTKSPSTIAQVINDINK